MTNATFGISPFQGQSIFCNPLSGLHPTLSDISLSATKTYVVNVRETDKFDCGGCKPDEKSVDALIHKKDDRVRKEFEKGAGGKSERFI